MKIMVSVLVTLAVSIGMYVVFLRTVSSKSGSPTETISTTTVQMQLVNLAQAERIYFIQNNAYGTIKDLASSGTFKLKDPDPTGYTYEVVTSPSGFKATAFHPDGKDGKNPSYPLMFIDEQMKVHSSN